MDKAEVLELITNLQEWHKNIVEQLQMVVNADDNMNFQMEDKDGNRVKMRDDMKPAFKAGISVALNLIEEFPITITEE